MTDVELARKNGETALKDRITAIAHPLTYEDTAYHLPISFALTGTAVDDQKAAVEVFTRMNNNPVVASECILAEKTASEGKE